MNWPQVGVKSSHDHTTIEPQSRRDRATIGPRSWFDRDGDPPWTSSEDRGIDSTLKYPRSRLNRAAIAVRSDRDCGVLPRVFYAVGLESDAPGIFTKGRGSRFTVAVGSRSRGESTASRPIGVDQVGWTVSIAQSNLATIVVRSRRIHAPKSSTWQQVNPRSPSLNQVTRTCCFDDRVDSGPRDLRRPDRIGRLPCVHVACKR